MGRRSTTSPYGSNDILVDNRIGSAFPIVCAVEKRLPEIIFLARQFGTLQQWHDDILEIGQEVTDLAQQVADNTEAVAEGAEYVETTLPTIIEYADRAEATRDEIELEFQQQLIKNGYQELGEYEVGIVIENLNQVVTVGNYLYRVSPAVSVPYTTSGDWEQDSGDFVQIDFVTASQLQAERDHRAAADSSLQQQVTEAAPIAAAERPIVQWHGQVIENSLAIPPNVNAFSFGPVLSIASGQYVTVGDGSSWTIANGEGESGSAVKAFDGNYDYGEVQ